MTDIRLGSTKRILFTSRDSSGVPTTLAGTPAVAAYADTDTTEITAGITLTVDLDGRTGLNAVEIVATDANGYAEDTDYSLVLTAGTVDSTSVVGEVVGSFTIEQAAAFKTNGNVTEINGSSAAATNLSQSTLGIIIGEAETGTLTTAAMSTNLTGYADDTLIDRAVVFISGTAIGQTAVIGDYASTNGLITFDEALAVAPADGDAFVIV